MMMILPIGSASGYVVGDVPQEPLEHIHGDTFVSAHLKFSRICPEIQHIRQKPTTGIFLQAPNELQGTTTAQWSQND